METITLVEAIEKGMALSQPLRKGYFSEGQDGTIYACPVACAYMGVGKIGNDLHWHVAYETLYDHFPELKESIQHPLSERIMPLEQVIYNLTDKYEWSREQILTYLKKGPTPAPAPLSPEEETRGE